MHPLGGATDSLVYGRGLDSPSAVLCLCADAEPGGCYRDRLSNVCEVIWARCESDAFAVLHEKPVAVVLLHPSEGLALSDIFGRTLLDHAPAATLLVCADQSSFHAHWLADFPRVRFLPDPHAPAILEQMIEDYLERFRFCRVEHTLTRELDTVQSRLDSLSEHNKHEFQDTASLLRLYHVVSGLNGLTTPQEIGELLVSTAAGLMRSRRVSLLLPDADRRFLTVVAAIGLPAEVVDGFRIPVGSPISGQVFAQARSILARREQIAGWKERYDHDLICGVPFISMVMAGPDSPLGVLNVSDPITPGAYSEESLTALQTIAEAAAIALANQIRVQERNDARDGIMMALAKLAESRDPETGAHLDRVQNYCRLLAQALAQTDKYRDVITPEFISTLVWSSPLHDIGKVGVPDQILLKPGQLTEEEFAIMKRHPIIGGDTIRTLIEGGCRQDFLEMAMQIAYFHHEKTDGSGYPYGLSGEDIPLPARIMALADVYDAMTTARVYKLPMPHEAAAELIKKDSGRHFDSDIVDAFILREPEFAKLAAELADTNQGVSPPVAGSAVQNLRPRGQQLPVSASVSVVKKGLVS